MPFYYYYHFFVWKKNGNMDINETEVIMFGRRGCGYINTFNRKPMCSFGCASILTFIDLVATSPIFAIRKEQLHSSSGLELYQIKYVVLNFGADRADNKMRLGKDRPDDSEIRGNKGRNC